MIEDLISRVVAALADPSARAALVGDADARRPLLAELALRDASVSAGDESQSTRVAEIEQLLGMGPSIGGTDRRARVIDRYAGGVAPSPSPVAILVVSEPASGKGPIVEQLCRELATFGHAVVVDLAEIAWLRNAAWRGDLDGAACNRDASEDAQALIDRAISTRQHLVVELRRCDRDTATLAQRLLEAEYDVALLVADTPPGEVAQRTEARRVAWQEALGDRVSGLAVVEAREQTVEAVDLSELVQHLMLSHAWRITPDGSAKPIEVEAANRSGAFAPRGKTAPTKPEPAQSTRVIAKNGKQRGVKIGNFAAKTSPPASDPEPTTPPPSSNGRPTPIEPAESVPQRLKTRTTKLGSFKKPTKQDQPASQDTSGQAASAEPPAEDSRAEAAATPAEEGLSVHATEPNAPSSVQEPPPASSAPVNADVLEKRRRLVRKIREWAAARGG